MISFRQADLLERAKRPLIPVEVDITIPFDAKTGRAAREGGKLFAHIGLQRPSHFEEIMTLIELTIGSRIQDRIYANEGEEFSHFGNRILYSLKKALETIAAGPLTIEKDKELGVCSFTLKFKVRL